MVATDALNDSYEDLKYLIAKEFGVEEILGNQYVKKIVDGRSWERHIENLLPLIENHIKEQQ